MIHLVFGSAAAAGLAHAFKEQGHEIIRFPIDFSIGPITNIHRDSGVTNYFSWLKTSFHPFWNYLEEDQRIFHQALKQLSEIKDGEDITIWTCENASEQIGLRISCYLLNEKSVKLQYVNTYQAMHQKEVHIEIRHTGECNAKQLASFYSHSVLPVSAARRNAYAEEGKKLVNSKSIVRSWLNGEIKEERETRDDAFILKCVKRVQQQNPDSEYTPAVKVIGEVISHSDQPLSDMWAEYRIRSLIQSGELIYEGDLKRMRSYNIKTVE